MNDKNDDLQLHLHKESSINSIQKAFNIYYPFLKINFTRHSYKSNALVKGSMLSDVERLKQLDIKYIGKVINVNKTRTVSEIEKELENLFGLSALIFRKSGNVWVETSLTEDWTLGEQNKEGEQISYHFTDEA